MPEFASSAIELTAPRELRLALLGEASLRRGSQEVLGRAVQRRRLAILILLVRAPGRRISRETILSLLWAESTPNAGRRLLNEAVYVLRRELGPETITSVADDLVLHDDVRCDADDFLRALAENAFSQAAFEYGGPFLGPWFVRDAPEFSRWVDDERSQLAQRYRDVVMVLAEQAERVGDWRLAAERLQLLLREDPLRSAVAYRAGLALARNGETAAALRLLRAHRELLVEEVGASPSREIVALESQIQTGAVRGDLAVSDRQDMRPEPPLPGPAAPRSVLPEPASPSGQQNGSNSRPDSRGRSRRWAAAVGVLGLLGAIAVVVLRPSITEPAPSAGAEPRQRLLVAPYRFTGPDDQRYLATGLLEDITSELAPQRRVQLLSSSLLRDTSDERKAIDVAASANADLLLEGRAQVDAVEGEARLSVSHTLVRVSTGEVLWSWRYRGVAADVVGLSSAIADSVAARLGLEPPSRPRGDDGSRDLAAIDFYHRGNEQRSKGRDGFAAARALYSSAIRRDSSYARALARHAEMTVRLKYYLLERDPAQITLASRLLERARAVSPSSAEVLLASSYWYLAAVDDTPRALAQLDSTLRLHPDFPEALTARATIRRRSGDWDGAVDDYRRALAIDPHAYPIRLEYGNTLLWMHQYAEARPQLEFARDLDTTAVDPPAWLAGLSIRESGDTLQAMRELSRALRSVNRERLYARLALTFPEVLRSGTGTLFRGLRPLTLKDALGDSAAYYMMRFNQADAPLRQRQAAADSAYALLSRWVALAINPHRTELRMASVMQTRGDSTGAFVHLARALVAAARRRDALSLAEARLVSAAVELQGGRPDSARVHVRQLMGEPSAMSPAVLQVDPLWRALKTPRVRASR